MGLSSHNLQNEQKKHLTCCDINDARLMEPAPNKDLEVLYAFSILLQSYLLTHASPSQRAEMGVPADLFDENILQGAKESYRNPSWWLAPFNGVPLDNSAPFTTAKFPNLRKFVEELHTGLDLSLSWERADTINREILAELEKEQD